MANINFYDKQGKVYPFEGTKEQFDKWNTFGFTLAPASSGTTGSGSKNPIVTPKGETGDSSLMGGLGDGQVDGLTRLKISLRDMTNKYYKKGVVETSGSALKFFQDKGYDSSKLPGGFSGKIIDMVERQVSANLQPAWDNMKDILTSIETNQTNATKTAQSTINMLMDNKSWSGLTTAQRSKLWETAGFPGDPILPSSVDVDGMKKEILSNIDNYYTQYENAKDPKAFKENVVKALTSTYGKDMSGYIDQVVGALMPDIISKSTKLEDMDVDSQLIIRQMNFQLKTQGFVTDNTTGETYKYDEIIRKYPQWQQYFTMPEETDIPT